MVWQFRSASEAAPRGEEARQGSRAVPEESPEHLVSLFSAASPESVLSSGCGRALTDLSACCAHSRLWASVHAAAHVWNTFVTCPNSESPPGSSSPCEAFPNYSDPFSPFLSFILQPLRLLHPANLQPNLGFVCSCPHITCVKLYKPKLHCNLCLFKDCVYMIYSLFFWVENGNT